MFVISVLIQGVNLLETLNFLNTATSADNTATFAVSTTVSTASSYSSVSQLSFNQHLQQSFESKVTKPTNDYNSPILLDSTDIESLASNIIVQIKKSTLENKVVRAEEQAQSIDELLSELNLNEQDTKTLKSTLDSLSAFNKQEVIDERPKLFNQLKNIIDDVKPQSLKNELSDLMADIDKFIGSTQEEALINIKSSDINTDAINTDAINTDAINTDAINTDAINTDAINTNAINTEEINTNAINTEEILNSIDKKLSEISIQLQSPTLAEAQKKSLIDMQVKLERVQHAINTSEGSVDDVSKIIESLDETLDDDSDFTQGLKVFNNYLNDQQPAKVRDESSDVSKLTPSKKNDEYIEGSLVQKVSGVNEKLTGSDVADFTDKKSSRIIENKLMEVIEKLPASYQLSDTVPLSNEEIDEIIKDKIISVIEKLPATQQAFLKQELDKVQQTNPVVKKNESISESPDKFLMSLEDSHKALSDVALSSSIKLNDSEKIINEKTNSEYGKKLTEEFVKQNMGKHDLSQDISQFNESSPKDSKIESIISQLESSFRASQQASSNVFDAAHVNAKIDQQALKDVSTLNQNVAKPSEALAPRISLHENTAAAQQLKEHLTMMSRGGLGQAVLQLDPEELGAMSVRIIMQNDQMTVSFQVQNPQAKELLEQAMNKLKESLEAQGIELNHSDVEQHNHGNDQSLESNEDSSKLKDGEFDETNVEPMTLTLNKQSANGIDYYA
jgi:flagellar hook-length control protein FliK